MNNSQSNDGTGAAAAAAAAAAPAPGASLSFGSLGSWDLATGGPAPPFGLTATSGKSPAAVGFGAPNPFLNSVGEYGAGFDPYPDFWNELAEGMSDTQFPPLLDGPGGEKAAIDAAPAPAAPAAPFGLTATSGESSAAAAAGAGAAMNVAPADAGASQCTNFSSAAGILTHPKLIFFKSTADGKSAFQNFLDVFFPRQPMTMAGSFSQDAHPEQEAAFRANMKGGYLSRICKRLPKKEGGTIYDIGEGYRTTSFEYAQFIIISVDQLDCVQSPDNIRAYATLKIQPSDIYGKEDLYIDVICSCDTHYCPPAPGKRGPGGGDIINFLKHIIFRHQKLENRLAGISLSAVPGDAVETYEKLGFEVVDEDEDDDEGLIPMYFTMQSVRGRKLELKPTSRIPAPGVGAGPAAADYAAAISTIAAAAGPAAGAEAMGKGIKRPAATGFGSYVMGKPPPPKFVNNTSDSSNQSSGSSNPRSKRQKRGGKKTRKNKKKKTKKNKKKKQKKTKHRKQ